MGPPRLFDDRKRWALCTAYIEPGNTMSASCRTDVFLASGAGDVRAGCPPIGRYAVARVGADKISPMMLSGSAASPSAQALLSAGAARSASRSKSSNH